MKTRTLQISNIAALILTVAVNYLSNTGIFNGNTMASVSASYQNLFTPAGYAFSIWGIIYIGLGAFVIYQSKGLFGPSGTRDIVDKVGWLFVVSCLANCLWVLAWLYDFTGISVIIMIILLSSLLMIMQRTRMELDVIALKKVALEWWPFTIYIGWISVALIADVAAYLTKIGWDGFGLSEVTWTIVMIVAAVAVNLLITWKRAMREAAMVGAWALVAIAVANWNGTSIVSYSAIAGAVILLINGAFHSYVNRGRHFIIMHPKMRQG
jgi:hypothetical protein